MDCSAKPDHAPHPPSEITSPRKAERPIPGTLIPGTRRFTTPSAASAGVAAPPSRTCGASDSVLHQRSGRQASVPPLTTADTRAAMTAEPTAICDQQTAEGAGRLLSGVQRPGPAMDRYPLPARKLVDDYAQVARTCQDSVSGIAGACGPKSPDSHRAVWGLTSRPPVPPAGFPPVTRLPAGSLPLVRLLLVFLVRRSPVRSLRPLPGFRFPFGFPPGSLPLSNLHVSAAVRRFRRRWSRPAGTKVTSPAATTSPGSRDPPALQMGSGWPRWDVATESPVTSGRERRTPRPNRPIGREYARWLRTSCSR